MKKHSLVKPVKSRYSFYLMPLLLLVADYVAILAAEYTGFFLRNYLIINGGTLHVSWLSSHVIAPVLFLLVFHVSDLYTRRMQFWKTMARIFTADFYAALALIMLMYLSKISGSTSRLFIFFVWLFAFIYVVGMRYLLKQVLSHVEVLAKPVLIMGAGKTAALVLQHIKNDSGLDYHFIGYLEDYIPDPSVAAALPCLGGFADAEQVIKTTGVKNIFVIAPGLSSSAIQELVYRLQPLVSSIGFIPDMGSLPLATLDMEALLDGHIVLFKLRNNLAYWYNRVLKCVFDFVVTLLGTICISPILLAIACWIYHDSPGPIIFKHKRVGKAGKEFNCYKFRSMCVDADKRLEELLRTNPAAKAEWEKDFKLKDDPRVTRSGAFLRKTSLDELPQIFNVLKGEMSLVGPRPIIQAEVLRYGKYIEDYYMVRPGITGMWQTSGRSDVDYDERVQMDTWYVRNWNIWFDVVLLWRTFKVVISKKGAY